MIMSCKNCLFMYKDCKVYPYLWRVKSKLLRVFRVQWRDYSKTIKFNIFPTTANVRLVQEPQF